MRREIDELHELLAKNNDLRSLRIKSAEATRRVHASKHGLERAKTTERVINDLINVRELQLLGEPEEGIVEHLVFLIEIYFTAEELPPDEEKEAEEEMLAAARRIRELLNVPDAPYGKR